MKLNRAYVNAMWLERFPMFMVYHMEISRSNHVALMTRHGKGDSSFSMGKKKKHIRFEEFWVGIDGCE